jgi:hypothetical protein
MAKRSDISSNGGSRVDDRVFIESKVKKPKVEKEKELAVSKEPDRVGVRNNYPANVKMAGQSGEVYVFPGIGTEVKVRAEDVEQLLARRRGGCCGAVPSFMFELVIK